MYNNPEEIDFHHFGKQTSEIGWNYYIKANKPKINYFYSTEDVNNICKLLDMPIFDSRQHFINIRPRLKKLIPFISHKSLYKHKFEEIREITKKYKFNDYSLFYNDNITKIVASIYKDDFIFFNDNNKYFDKPNN